MKNERESYFVSLEPFTKQQEIAVQMFHRICALEQTDHGKAFELRLKLANLNAANDWNMTDVAFAARLNFWPTKSQIETALERGEL